MSTATPEPAEGGLMTEADHTVPRLYAPWVGRMVNGHIVVQFCPFPGRADQQRELEFDDLREATTWLADALAKVQGFDTANPEMRQG